MRARSYIRGLPEEKIIEDDVAVFLVEEEKINLDTTGEVNIPFYWKAGLPEESRDYLDGYIPSVNEFVNYITTKDSILYSKTQKGKTFENYKDVYHLLNNKNILFSKGITNTHPYFEWKESECATMRSEELNETLFLCEKWVNWMGRYVNEPYFVLTKCNIKGVTGQCVFLDFVSVFFNEKQQVENRCIAFESSKYCSLEEYLDLIKNN